MIKGNEFENIVNDPRESITGDPNRVEIKVQYDTSKIEQGSSDWTLFFNITNTTLQQGEFDRLVVAIETPGGSNRLTQQYSIGEGMGKIYKNITINPPSGANISLTQIVFYTEIPGRSITIRDVMLVKGTYHKYIDHFNGTKKLGPNIHLITHNKNLASIKLEKGSIDGTTGENIPPSPPLHAVRFKDFTSVTPGLTYVFSTNIPNIKNDYWTTVLCYDTNKKFIRNFEVKNIDKVQFTVPPGCYYVKCRVEGNFDIPRDIYDVKYQLEVGTTVTSYTKPQYNIKDISVPQGIGSDQVLIYDKEYGKYVIKEIAQPQQKPLIFKRTLSTTNIYDIEMKTYDDQTWFSILDDGVFSNVLLGSISYDYEYDPVYDHQGKGYYIILKNGAVVDGGLYKTITNMKDKGIEYIKLTDGYYGSPDKYIPVNQIVKTIMHKE